MADKLELLVQLQDEFSKTLKDYKKETDQASKGNKKLRAETEKTNKKLETQKKRVKALKVGMVAFSGAAVFAAKKTFDLVAAQNEEIDELNKLSQAYGVSIENLSAYNYVAELNKTSSEAMNNTFKKLSMELGQLSVATDSAVNKFEEIGIETKNTDGTMKSLNDIFLESIDALNSIEDRTERSAKATLLFGKNASELGAIINQGSDAIREQVKEAERLGVVYNDDLAKGAEEFNDNLLRMQSSVKGLSIAFVNTFGDSLTNMFDTATDHFVNLRNAMKNSEEIEIGGITLTKGEAESAYDEAISEARNVSKAVEGSFFQFDLDQAKVLRMSYTEYKVFREELVGYYSALDAQQETQAKKEQARLQEQRKNIVKNNEERAKQVQSKTTAKKKESTEDFNKRLEAQREEQRILASYMVDVEQSQKRQEAIDTYKNEQRQKQIESEQELTEFLAEQEKERTRIKLEELDEQARAQKAQVDYTFDIFSGVSGSLAGIDDAVTKNKLANLKKQGLSDEEYAEKSKEIMEKQNNRNAVMAVANGLLAGTKTLSELGVPVGLPFAAIAVANGIASAASIKSQTFASGGVVDSTNISGDNNYIRTNGDEMIATKAQQTTMFNALNNNTLGGGGGGVNVTISGNSGVDESALARMVVSGIARAEKRKQPRRIL